MWCWAKRLLSTYSPNWWITFSIVYYILLWWYYFLKSETYLILGYYHIFGVFFGQADPFYEYYMMVLMVIAWNPISYAFHYAGRDHWRLLRTAGDGSSFSFCLLCRRGICLRGGGDNNMPSRWGGGDNNKGLRCSIFVVLFKSVLFSSSLFPDSLTRQTFLYSDTLGHTGYRIAIAFMGLTESYPFLLYFVGLMVHNCFELTPPYDGWLLTSLVLRLDWDPVFKTPWE